MGVNGLATCSSYFFREVAKKKSKRHQLGSKICKDNDRILEEVLHVALVTLLYNIIA